MSDDGTLDEPLPHDATMTWGDLVRVVGARHGFLTLNEVDCDFVLWEHTAFPMADAAYVTKQLDRYFEHCAFERDAGRLVAHDELTSYEADDIERRLRDEDT